MTGHQKFIAALAVGAFAVSLAGCGSDDKVAANDAGPAGSRSFALADFTGVELMSSDTVIVRQGAVFSVVAKGPQSVLDQLEIDVSGDSLRIGRKSKMALWNGGNRGAATITVTIPRLDGASLAGSGNMNIDKAEGDSVDVSVAGSGDLVIGSVSAKSLELTVAGAGDLTIKAGTAAKGDFSVVGSGNIAAAAVVLTDVEVSVSGSGDVEAQASGTADVSIMGSGDVTVTGGAKCNTEKLGSGEIRCS